MTKELRHVADPRTFKEHAKRPVLSRSEVAIILNLSSHTGAWPPRSGLREFCCFVEATRLSDRTRSPPEDYKSIHFHGQSSRRTQEIKEENIAHFSVLCNWRSLSSTEISVVTCQCPHPRLTKSTVQLRVVVFPV